MNETANCSPALTNSSADAASIRVMGETDVEAVHEIEQLASPKPWTREMFREEFTQPKPNRLWLVADRGSLSSLASTRLGQANAGLGLHSLANDSLDEGGAVAGSSKNDGDSLPRWGVATAYAGASLAASNLPTARLGVVGFAGLMFELDLVHVMNIAVAPAFQNSGIGSHLLSALIGAATERDAGLRITLEVRESATAARALYKKFGFENVGARSGYYGGTEDALIMTRPAEGELGK